MARGTHIDGHTPPAHAPRPTGPPPKPSDAKRAMPKAKAELPRFDQALRQACNAKQRVILSMAVPVFLPVAANVGDALDTIEGDILEADTYAIKIRLTRPVDGLEMWISKSHIVATYIVAK